MTSLAYMLTSVPDILFSNFEVMDADAGPTISEDSGDNGSFPGMSLMQVSNVAFVNFTGYLSGEESTNETATISCSEVQYVLLYSWLQKECKLIPDNHHSPCYNIAYENVT